MNIRPSNYRRWLHHWCWEQSWLPNFKPGVAKTQHAILLILTRLEMVVTDTYSVVLSTYIYFLAFKLLGWEKFNE